MLYIPDYLYIVFALKPLKEHQFCKVFVLVFGNNSQGSFKYYVNPKGVLGEISLGGKGEGVGGGGGRE